MNLTQEWLWFWRFLKAFFVYRAIVRMCWLWLWLCTKTFKFLSNEKMTQLEKKGKKGLFNGVGVLCGAKIDCI